MATRDSVFVESLIQNIQERNAKDSIVIYQHNYDTMGDVFPPEPTPIKLSFYDVHTIVAGDYPTNDSNIRRITVDAFRSYNLSFGPVFTFKEEIINNTIPSIDDNLKQISTHVLKSYNVRFGPFSTGDPDLIKKPLMTSDNFKLIDADIFRSYEMFFGPISTGQFNRLNSNIYKNIFAESVTDIEYISKIKESVRTSEQDIIQENHGFDLYDAVYLDSNSQYQKALAENTEKALVKGIVTRITNKNIFTLMDIGKSNYIHLDLQDTSFLYLSDKRPGKLVHYTEITNTVYVPLAVYANDSIIINIQQGSAGDTMVPYVPPESLFDEYTQEELNNTIGQIILAV